MDEAVRDITSFKPSRFSRDVAKHERKELRAKVRAAEDRRESAEWTAISKAIYVRDHGCCRVCGRETKRLSENPLLRAQCHHIVYRSAGGGDHSDNLINVCGVCHDQEHAHVIQITGHGDGVVSIIKTNLETGRVVRAWESECPK